MKIVTTLLLILLTKLLIAQSSITGKVIDDKQKPLQSASVLLMQPKDSVLITAVFTDNNGSFRFNSVSNGKYIISVSMVGYKRTYINTTVNANTELNITKLQSNGGTLAEVTVTSTKPFLEQRADKLVVNVENSATAAGSSALEVLQKVPGIIVMNDKITMPGKGTPMILIDGRATLYTDMNQVLRDISSANIEKIEVISNPGARYDASGGAVINIVLKRNANLGTNATLVLNTGQGIYNRKNDGVDQNFYRFNPAFSINNRKGKWNVYGGYSFFRRNQFEISEFTRNIGTNRFVQINYNPNDVSSHNYRAGVDFYANKKNTFGILVRGFNRSGGSNTTNTTLQQQASTSNLLSSFQTFNNTATSRNNIAANINWKHQFDTTGHDLNIDLDFSRFNIRNNSDILNSLSSGVKYTNNQFVDNPVRYGVFKADYIKPFSDKLKLEAGIKSSYATIDNYLLFYQRNILDASRSTNFIYKENINAAYASIQHKIKDWEITAGLRTEQTVARGDNSGVRALDRSYWQLFPSAFIGRKLNSKMNMNLQYSRRVERPSYQQQNPFVMFLDSLTYTQGNPLLRPQVTDSWKIGLTYENQPVIAVSINKTKDVIFENAPKQNGNLTFTTPENLAAYNNVTIELNLPIPLGKKFNGFIHNEAVYNHYKADYLGGTYNQSRWHYMLFSQLAYKPTPSWNIEMSGFFMTKFLEEFITIKPMGAFNFGISKTFMEKKARIAINFSDVFYNQRTRGEIIYQDINLNFLQRAESRNIRLSLSYSFGNQKLKAARSRSTGSDAEANRVKTN